jgi:hypothetical protein
VGKQGSRCKGKKRKQGEEDRKKEEGEERGRERYKSKRKAKIKGGKESGGGDQEKEKANMWLIEDLEVMKLVRLSLYTTLIHAKV